MSTRVWIGPNEARDVEVISSTQLVARYMGGGAHGEPEDVTVQTSTGQATARDAFVHESPPPTPTINGVTPSSGRSGTLVTVTGTGFET